MHLWSVVVLSLVENPIKRDDLEVPLFLDTHLGGGHSDIFGMLTPKKKGKMIVTP